MDAIYVSNNAFKVSDDRTSEFINGRRIKATMGEDGIAYSWYLISNKIACLNLLKGGFNI